MRSRQVQRPAFVAQKATTAVFVTPWTAGCPNWSPRSRQAGGMGRRHGPWTARMPELVASESTGRRDGTAARAVDRPDARIGRLGVDRPGHKTAETARMPELVASESAGRGAGRRHGPWTARMPELVASESAGRGAGRRHGPWTARMPELVASESTGRRDGTAARAVDGPDARIGRLGVDRPRRGTAARRVEGEGRRRHGRQGERRYCEGRPGDRCKLGGSLSAPDAQPAAPA